MKWKTSLLWMSVLLVCPTISSGQSTTLHFEFLPSSTYTYFPPGFAGVNNCSPSNFQCDFALAGLFSLEIDSLSGTASITNSNLVLVGNESVSGPSLLSESGLEAWLEGQEFLGIPTVGTMSAYRVEATSFTRFPLTLSYDNPGINGALTGGFDSRFLDGDGLSIQASLRQVAIPEPSAATVLGLLGFAAFHVRRRVR